MCVVFISFLIFLLVCRLGHVFPNKDIVVFSLKYWSRICLKDLCCYSPPCLAFKIVLL